jgi:flagellar basal body-associated protein FliL
MDAFLILILLAIVLSVGGTIISLRLFAHGSEHVSRPRSARRVYVAPSSYTTETNFAVEDHETARYARKATVTLVILLVILSAWIFSAFHALVH